MENKHSNWTREQFEVFRNDEFAPELQDALVVQRDGLWRAINSAIEAGIQDAEELHPERFDLRLVEYKPESGLLRITTRESRDWSRASNGGEYFYYTVFRQTSIGVSTEDEWSCDFADINPEWHRPTLFVGTSLADAYDLLTKVPYHNGRINVDVLVD